MNHQRLKNRKLPSSAADFYRRSEMQKTEQVAASTQTSGNYEQCGHCVTLTAKYRQAMLSQGSLIEQMREEADSIVEEK